MIKPSVEKRWVWDQQLNQLVEKIEIYVQVIGTKGTVFDEEGPLWVLNGQEVFEAVTLLRNRLTSRLSGLANLQNPL